MAAELMNAFPRFLMIRTGASFAVEADFNYKAYNWFVRSLSRHT